jgi:uncharacterized protein Yka (UPF0111/DUF47 family)
MFSKLFPREFNFFDFLDNEIAVTVKAADLFKEIVNKGVIDDAGREKMRDIEHEGDKMAYAIIDHLNKTFVTPFDREDIHTLAKKIDDINDMINTIVSRMKVYRVTKVNGTLVEFADLIVESVKSLACAIKGLRDLKNAHNTLKSCMDVGRMESTGDKLRDKALGDLFDNEKNPVEIIKWKELYQDAETVLDICKVVAHTVESILVKQA